MKSKYSLKVPSMVVGMTAFLLSTLLAISPAQEGMSYEKEVDSSCKTEVDSAVLIGKPVVGTAGLLGGSNASLIIRVLPISESCSSKISTIALTSGESLASSPSGVPLMMSNSSTSTFEVRLQGAAGRLPTLEKNAICRNNLDDLAIVILRADEEMLRQDLWVRDPEAPKLPGCDKFSEATLNLVD